MGDNTEDIGAVVREVMEDLIDSACRAALLEHTAEMLVNSVIKIAYNEILLELQKEMAAVADEENEKGVAQKDAEEAATLREESGPEEGGAEIRPRLVPDSQADDAPSPAPSSTRVISAASTWPRRRATKAHEHDRRDVGILMRELYSFLPFMGSQSVTRQCRYLIDSQEGTWVLFVSEQHVWPDAGRLVLRARYH